MAPRTALRTERLVLRPLRPEDASWIAKDIARPEVQRMLPSVPHPHRRADTESWLDRRRRWPGNYAITQGGMPLGVVTLALASGATELGYWLARRAWGQGIATEAARAVLRQHFTTFSLPVPSGHILDNLASRRVLLKLGFTDIGLIFCDSLFRGHSVVIRRMALNRDSWAAQDG